MDKQLSKEDFLEKSYETIFSSQKYSNRVNLKMDEKWVLPAMDEYAKQTAIGFAEFIKDNHYTRNLNSEDIRWYKYFSVNEELPSGVMISSGVSEYFTTEQLFSQYLQSL